MALGELCRGVLVSPDSPDVRLKLAQEFYRIDDLDAALDECRVAIKFEPNNANAHLQLGITLMAQQDGRSLSLP